MCEHKFPICLEKHQGIECYIIQQEYGSFWQAFLASQRVYVINSEGHCLWPNPGLATRPSQANQRIQINSENQKKEIY